MRLIVGGPPGGPSDILARLMGQWLSERLGQPFIVREPAGRRDQYRTEVVVHAPADGYTLLLIGTANAINATLYEKLNFNFIRDIAPVAGIIRGPLVMVVNPAVPAKTVPEFIAYAKANPGKINMASAGIGTSSHVCRRAVQDDGRRRHGPRAVSRHGARADRPARRTGAGDVRQPAASIEYIRAGKLRALAVTTATRSDALPDIPTVGEFVPGYEASAWFGIGAPKNTPAEIVDKLNKEINAGLADPKMKARLADLGAHGAFRLARRLRQAHRRRNREVGQGGQVRGHQAGVINPCGGFAIP